MPKATLKDLPEEVRDVILPYMAEAADTLAAIGLSISKRRDEAKAARTSSGIEAVWKEAEEAYIGIDDANRSEFKDARWSKPMAMDGPVTTDNQPKSPTHKSTAFVRLTARYVDAGAAKLGEILLPADDKAFKFSEMPVPELIKAKDDTSQVVSEDLGQPLTRPAQPGEPVPGATPPPAAAPTPGAVLAPGAAAVPAAAPAPVMPAPAPPVIGPTLLNGAAPLLGAPTAPPAAPPAEVPLTVKDLAEENIAISRKAAKAAEERIYSWMVGCQHTAEMRKVIDDAARIGVGVLNGPIPVNEKGIAVERTEDQINIFVKKKIVPATRWRDPWNIFPDPACGENIHNGNFIFDRDFLSPRQVRELRELPGYIPSQIDKVLNEGPEGVTKDNDDLSSAGSQGQAQLKGRFEVWYYYGTLKRVEMGVIWVAANKKLDGLPADKSEVYAIVTMINNHVVRATINPLDSGAFPYHSVPWQRRAGHWAGIGVGEQIRMPQKLINQATRAMINNAGKSAGSQVVVDRGVINPADGSWLLTPDKIWNKIADTAGDVNSAFAMHTVPNQTDNLMKIIHYALQLAEESTSIPLITQGMSGETQPNTLGGMNLQNNNANQLLRSIGYAFDDHITEPVVRQYYEWLLLDPNVPDEEKGEFQINAHGSIALVERAIQDQTIAQMAQTVKDPTFGINPKKWMKLFLKSKRLDPADLQYTEEEQKKIDSTPPPVAPVVQVAQIKAHTDTMAIAAKQGEGQQTRQHEQQLAQATAVLEGSRIQAEDNRTLVDHVGWMHELQMKHELALLEYAKEHRMQVTEVRAMLAKTAMTLDTQRELSTDAHRVDIHKHNNPQPKAAPQVAEPLAEPPGRAKPGEAFTA